LLATAGSRWDDWRAFTPGDVADRLGNFRETISTTIDAQFGDSDLFVLKDPRICRFVPFYRHILSDKGIACRPVLIFRNPLAVMASLRARDKMTAGFAGLLWLRHMLDAERATRGARVLVAYERFVADWRAVIADIAMKHAISWPTPMSEAAAAIGAFVAPDLQHYQFTDHDLQSRPEVTPWIKSAYQAVQAMTQDPGEEGKATAVLDGIAAEFDRWSLVFGAASFPEIAARELAWNAERSRLTSEIERAAAL
jgi:hypothetical protein